jgi:predicted metal-dependent phosphoesterase TrpH
MLKKERAQKMKVDLHLHTNASDGTWTNEILLQRIKEHHITIFSITDHNTIENALLMREICDEPGIVYIPGVELSCRHAGKEYHITAYAFDPAATDLRNLLASNQQILDRWLQAVMEYTAAATGAFTLEQYRQYENDRSRGGNKAINFLLDLGVIATWEGFIKYAFDSGRTAEFPGAAAVIETVKRAGGRPILAHPSVYAGRPMEDKELAEWIELGIAGLECFHPSAAAQAEVQFYLDFCRKHDLMITGGSDCHGEFGRRRTIGQPEITLEMIRTDFIG